MALTNNINLLQPSQFKVIVNRQRFGNFEFFAQSFNHPGLSVNPPALPTRRLSNVSIPGDTVTFDELSFDVLADEDMNSYIELFNWLKGGVENNYKPPTERGSDAAYIHEADITVNILSSHNNTTRTIKYTDCVPTSIGTLSMLATSTDTTPITFPITFRTSYFEIR